MKRITALILALCITVSMAGCGSKPAAEEDYVEFEAKVERKADKNKDEKPDVQPESPEPPTNEQAPTEGSTEQPEAGALEEPAQQPAPTPEQPLTPAPTSTEHQTEDIVVERTLSDTTNTEDTYTTKNGQSTFTSGVGQSTSRSKAAVDKPSEEPVKATSANSKEVRAVWISYLDFNTLLKGKSKAQFTENISKAFTKCKNAGINTVFVQVRPFGDALYESDYFPWSYTITGTEGKDPGFDPLQIMVREAHNRGLKIEAWINPYRIRNTGYHDKISEKNVAMDYYNEGSDAVIKYNGGYSYNPASKTARALITNGVVEIVQKYDVDGIHFDDYFYPTTDAAFDSVYYNKSGKTKSLADWRRDNVNTLVKQVYSAVKKEDSTVKFGISPAGNLSNNYNQQYSDVELWMANSGYVDYICPQLYWGFDHKTAPYNTMVEQWNSKIRSKDVDLYIGLAPYKLGTTEASYAGNGVNEWKNTSDLIARMVTSGRKASNYGGFALFRYDSVFNPAANVKDQVSKEMENLKEVL